MANTNNNTNNKLVLCSSEVVGEQINAIRQEVGDRTVSNQLETKPRWPGAPLVCEASNLPGFSTWAEATKFNAQNGGLSIMLKWECKWCGRWHYWVKPPSPAGDSSGSGRLYEVPERIRALVKESDREGK
jgi:hypothetical protein